MPYTRGKSQKIRVAGCAFNTVAAIPAYLSCKGIQIIEVWVCSCKTCLRNCWSNPFCENFRRYTNIKYDKYAYASPRIAWRPTGWHSFEMWQWQHQYFLKEPAKIFHPKVCLEVMGLRCLKHSMVDIGSWISEIIKKSSMLLGYHPYLQTHSLIAFAGSLTLESPDRVCQRLISKHHPERSTWPTVVLSFLPRANGGEASFTVVGSVTFRNNNKRCGNGRRTVIHAVNSGRNLILSVLTASFQVGTPSPQKLIGTIWRFHLFGKICVQPKGLL